MFGKLYRRASLITLPERGDHKQQTICFCAMEGNGVPLSDAAIIWIL
jgi:hypothetical protein